MNELFNSKPRAKNIPCLSLGGVAVKRLDGVQYLNIFCQKLTNMFGKPIFDLARDLARNLTQGPFDAGTRGHFDIVTLAGRRSRIEGTIPLGISVPEGNGLMHV